jgi:hypothetical protein
MQWKYPEESKTEFLNLTRVIMHKENETLLDRRKGGLTKRTGAETDAEVA